MGILNAKRAELKEVQDRLAELQFNFKAATDKKEQLEFQVCYYHILLEYFTQFFEFDYDKFLNFH